MKVTRQESGQPDTPDHQGVNGAAPTGARQGLLIDANESVSADTVSYRMLVSPGSVQLKSSGMKSPNNPTTRKDRTAITAWSRQSRTNFLKQIASLDLSPLADTGVTGMVTLTYPGEWRSVVASRSALNKHWRAFKRLWDRCWGVPLRCIWKVEFQRRGAPHIHMFTAIPTGLSRHRSATLDGLAFNEWLSVAWAGVVGHEDEAERLKHLRAGTGVDFQRGIAAMDGRRVASYFYKFGYLYKYEDADGQSLDYQHQAPSEWIAANDVGRFWGYCGLEKHRETLELTREQFAEARRVLRKVARSQGARRARVTALEVDQRTGEVVSKKSVRWTTCTASRSDGSLYGGFHLSIDGSQLGGNIARHVGASDSKAAGSVRSNTRK